MPRARILILTSGALSANPRPLKEASSLAKHGYAVTVINPNLSHTHASSDARLLSSNSYEQLVLPFDHHFATRCVTWLARRALRLGIDHRRALGPSHGILKAARRQSADLIIAHNEVAHWVGLQLLREGRRVAADIEDWHSEDLSVESRRYRPLRTLRRHEQLLLQNAAYCTTTSEVMADALFARYGGTRPEVITNSFPLQKRPPSRETSQPVRFFWFSQTIGPDRGLEQLMQAWGKSDGESELTLLGYGSAAYIEKLRSLLPEWRRAALIIHPLVHPDDLPEIIARHDVGLAIEVSSIPNRNLTITNKILQYCNAGVAIIATATRGQQEVLRNDLGAGAFVDLSDIKQFSSVMTRLAHNRAELLGQQQAARKLAESKYNWELEERTLLRLVDTALRRPA